MKLNRKRNDTSSVVNDKKADSLFTTRDIILPVAQDIVKKTAENMGFFVIEQKELIKPDDILLKAVVWQRGGVVIDDLVLITREVMGRFETNPRISAEGYVDILRLELSSPGIGRKLKSMDELAFFEGSIVNVSLIKPESGSFELTGEIQRYVNNVLTLKQRDGIVEINSGNISSARLAG